MWESAVNKSFDIGHQNKTRAYVKSVKSFSRRPLSFSYIFLSQQWDISCTEHSMLCKLSGKNHRLHGCACDLGVHLVPFLRHHKGPKRNFPKEIKSYTGNTMKLFF